MTTTSPARTAGPPQRPRSNLRVLRLCSVFEPDPVQLSRPHFDPIGGMQNHTAALTRALDARGLEQTVLTSRLGGRRSESRLCESARIVRVGLPIRRLRQMWAPSAVPAALRAGPYDVVHVHQGEDLGVLPLGVAMARRFRCALVVTLHCSLRHSLTCADRRSTALRLLGGALEHRLLRQVHTVITLTRRTAAHLDAGFHRTVVIPSGVETEAFADAAPHALLQHVAGPRILYVGRLARQKDVPTLVQAFGLLRHPASLVVVGDGPERAAVDAAISGLPADRRRRVHRRGFVAHSDVPSLMAGADVLVLPSVYEEMGSVLVEALHAGLPVVATDVGGIPTVVEHERTGLLVPPRNPAALADALDALLADPRRMAAMAANSRAAGRGYAWDGLAAQVLAVYEEAVVAARSAV